MAYGTPEYFRRSPLQKPLLPPELLPPVESFVPEVRAELLKLCECGEETRTPRATWCAECVKSRQRAKVRAWNTRRKGEGETRRKLLEQYGLTPADYDAMLESQGGACAICSRTETEMGRLHVDIGLLTQGSFPPAFAGALPSAADTLGVGRKRQINPQNGERASPGHRPRNTDGPRTQEGIAAEPRTTQLSRTGLRLQKGVDNLKE